MIPSFLLQFDARDVCPSCDLGSILRIWHGVQIVNYGHNTSGECSQKGADRDILILLTEYELEECRLQGVRQLAVNGNISG